MQTKGFPVMWKNYDPDSRKEISESLDIFESLDSIFFLQ